MGRGLVRNFLYLAALSVLLQIQVPLLAGAGLSADEVRSMRDSLIARENALYDQLDIADNGPFALPMLTTYGEWIDIDATQSANILNNKSISVWLEATYLVHFHTLSPRVFEQARHLFGALESRDAQRNSDVRRMIEMAIGAREFVFANQLVARYPELNIETVPSVEYSSGFDEEQPALLEVKDYGTRLSASNAPVESGELRLVFVFHPRCSFSRKAAEELQLLKHFDCFSSSYGDWVAPMHFQVESAAIWEWNEANPQSAVRLVYNPHAWEPIYFTETPAFYLLDGDEVLSLTLGWEPERTPHKVNDMLSTFLGRAGIRDCRTNFEEPGGQ